MPDPIHARVAKREGLNMVIPAGELESLSLDLRVLRKGQSYTFSTGGTEAAAVIMSGDSLVRVQSVLPRLWLGGICLALS